jgi:hypothetical protein
MGKRQHNVSPEARARMSARMKARWEADREGMIGISRRGGLKRGSTNPKKWPERGTEERRIFSKIANNANAAVAHAYFARART